MLLNVLFSLGQTGAGLVMLYPCQTVAFCGAFLVWCYWRALMTGGRA